ncbi:hypothetical protein [Oceanicoccus sagamiensis]|uniref:Uncharacterized protein n=1 Tax=Oceanicoccus sagamiensis TaxID=716816 RepID=A0A1X9NEQ5_9GAMM|nr:hypothetical protein [Oceanicoccus sagamiensis]ARN76026.1 hypothetical protein BST96_19160 [Oceanicoccus sagamiensis]
MDKLLSVCPVLLISCLLLACNPASHSHGQAVAIADPHEDMQDFCELSLERLSELNVIIAVPHNHSSAMDNRQNGDFPLYTAAGRHRS